MLNLRPMDKTETAEFLSSGEPETLEYFKANVSDGFDNSTLGVGLDVVKEAVASTPDKRASDEQAQENINAYYEKRQPRVVDPESPQLPKKYTVDDYKKSEHYRDGVEFQDGWSEERAKYLAESYDQRKVREQTIDIGAKSDKTMWGSGLAGQMVGGLPDPINFIPFGGAASKGARIGEKLIRGAVEGAVGNLAVSSITRPYYEKRGVDSDFQDYVNDTFIGGALGGGFATAGHAMSLRKGAKLKERAQMGKAADAATDAIISGDELDLNSKVQGMNEAIREMRSIPEVMKSERVELEVSKLEELGISREEAHTSITPMAAHVELISSYTGKTFDESWDEFGASFQAAELKDGKIVASEDAKIGREVEAWIDSELKTMGEDVRMAEQGKRGAAQIINPEDGQGYIKNIDTSTRSSYPSWYSEMGIKNKEQFFEVLESKKGPVYQRLRKLAEERLEFGNEKNGPTQEYLQAKSKLAQKPEESFRKKSDKKDRGAISFKDDGKAVISLFKDADRSTIVHESGHLFLNNLERLSKMENIPDALKKDFDTIKEWMGVKGNKIETKHHEKFARGFEQYLREGKAPRKDLERVFKKFSDWLKSIYKRSEDLKAELSPAAREVYGRLLGSDKEVDLSPTTAPVAPEPRFKSEADLDAKVNEVEKAVLEARESGVGEEDIQVLREALESIDEDLQAIDHTLTLFQSGKVDSDAAAKAAGISKNKMEEIIEAFNEKLLRDAGEKVDPVRAAEVADELRMELAIEAKELKRQAYLSGLARSETMMNARKLLDSGMDARAAVLSQIEGDSSGRGIEGAGNSLDGNYRSLSQSTLGKMHSELKAIDPTIEKLFESDPSFNENVLLEMMQIREDGSGKVGITNDPHAVKAAEILSRYAEDFRTRANLAGARIGKLHGWTPRTHDADKIILKGETAWINFMRDALDLDKSFKGLSGERLDRALYETYQNIITGVRKEHGEIDVSQPIRKPPRNVAKKLGEQRVLHFKNAEVELSYLKEFGQGSNVLQTMSRHLDNSARKISLMEKFGTNPEATLASVVDGLAQDIRDKKLFPDMDDKSRKKELDKLGNKMKLSSREGAIGKALMFALGEGNSFEFPRVKFYAQMVRSLNGVSKLGSATLSQFSDFTQLVNEKRLVSGDNFATAWADTLKDYIKGASPELQTKVLDHLGVMVDGINYANFNRFDADNINNRLARWNDKLMRLSGQDWHTRHAKSGFALSLSRELGSSIEKSWDELGDGLKEMLTQYGSFNSERWDLVRSIGAEDVDGDKYFHPDLLSKIDDSKFESSIPEEFRLEKRPPLQKEMAVTGQEEVPKELKDWEEKRDYHLKRAKFKLETDLRTFFIEETRNAVLEPDAKIKRLTSLGTKGGTISGEAARMLMQFKSFAVTYMDRSLRGKRMMKEAGDYGGLIHHATSALMLGYVSMTAKDLAKGLTPKDPKEKKTWYMAAMQSGGLGILGDFAGAAISSRSGADIFATVMGPTAGTAANALNLAGKTIREPLNKDPNAPGLLSDYVDFGRSLTPFSTLWYTRAAQDYLIWSRLKESLEPGSIRRSERRLKKEYGQRYIYRP